MRLVTLNTWGMRGDWKTRLPVFQDGFAALDADIVTLQETILSADADQAAEMLGPATSPAPAWSPRCWRQNPTAAARRLESLVAESPGHVIVAGDMNADGASDSMRFWTGRHVIDLSVCYRSVWESLHPGEPLATFTPENQLSVNLDWPFRGIDHILVRCGEGGPSLAIRGCRRTFDRGPDSASDHYGLVAELEPWPA